MSKTLILDSNVTKAKEEAAVKEIMGGPHISKPRERAPVADYNEINLLEMDDVKQAKLEYWIAKKVGSHLMSKFPNRQWGVGVDVSGGMIHVMCPSLSTTKAYYISLVGRTISDLTKRAEEAAGEILERYNVSRARSFDPENLETLERDARDEVVSPDAAPEPIAKVRP
jgi:hypothetical protein